jgi:hypothetical protein
MSHIDREAREQDDRYGPRSWLALHQPSGRVSRGHVPGGKGVEAGYLDIVSGGHEDAR